MGFTFVSMIIAGGLLGGAIHWVLSIMVDGWNIESRIFIVSGAVCGIIVGMADFIKSAMKALKDEK